MDEIWDRIKATKINRKYLIASLILTELLGIFIFIWLLRIPLSQKFFTIDPKAYSVVSMSPKKRYLLAQGDLLTGKAIPNTTVKVLITPSFSKNQITADSKGDWWYQVPPDIQKSIHTITFGNFDKNNKLVTFQSYKFRVKSNISLIQPINSLWKKVNSIFDTRPALAQMRTGIQPDLYINVGLPPPHIPTILTEEQRYRFQNFFIPHAYPAAKITGADWRLMAMFSLKEEHLTNFLDNCLDGNRDFGPDADYDPNTPCTGWGIPQWQVGWGHYPAQWANEKLAEAIAVMRPGKTIQQIGQEVIDASHNSDMYATYPWLKEEDLLTYKNPITYPDRFPDDVTLEEIIDGSQAILNDGNSANTEPTEEEKNLVIGTNTCRPIVDKNTNPRQDPKDCYMRQLLGILMKDPAISAYLLALMWKDLYDDQQIIEEIRYQWGTGFDLQLASNMIAGFDNEASGIDLEAIAITPQITMPVAVATQVQSTQDPVYPIDGVQVETVVSEQGAALDGEQLNRNNLKLEYEIRPKDQTAIDGQLSPSDSNVKGVSTIRDIRLDEEVLTNPSNYELCASLEPLDYDVKIDEKCIPVDQIIDPQIPTDSETAQAVIEIPTDQQFFEKQFSEEQTSCEPSEWIDEQPYSCENGYACYNRWKITGGDQCTPEARYGEDGLWYECYENPACGEVPQEEASQNEEY